MVPSEGNQAYPMQFRCYVCFEPRRLEAWSKTGGDAWHDTAEAPGRTTNVMWSNLHLLFWLTLFPFGTGWMDQSHFGAADRRLRFCAADGRDRLLVSGAQHPEAGRTVVRVAPGNRHRSQRQDLAVSLSHRNRPRLRQTVARLHALRLRRRNVDRARPSYRTRTRTVVDAGRPSTVAQANKRFAA